MPSRIQVAEIEVRRAAEALAHRAREHGVRDAARLLGRVAWTQATFPLLIRRRAAERFVFMGTPLPYTCARYNNSFANERSVEISIASWFLSRHQGSRMLEVGNVLSHYGVTGHAVIDRYETIDGVLNEDIVDFRPHEQYDLVVSISTLEHVGWDEEPRRPERAVLAFENVLTLTARSSAAALLTFPFGYNAALDEAVVSGRLRAPVQTAMVRVDRANHWVEAPIEEARTRSYGRPFDQANAIYVGMKRA